MRRLAAADIGSNTVHALVADWDGDALVDVASHVEMPSLGEVVARTGRAGAALDRVVAAFARVVAAARADGADLVAAGATEAVRRAADGDRLLEAASAAAGLPVRLLTEEAEGRLSFLGAAQRHAVAAEWLLCDIGGGSTELVTGRGRRAEAVVSLPLGSGVLAARHLSDPPAPGERERVRREALEALAGGPDGEAERLVATGGTAANLPRLLGAPAGEAIGVRALLEAAGRLDAGPAARVARARGLPAARVRAMRAGVEILLAVADWAGVDRVVPTHAGLRHGMLAAYLERGEDWWR